MSSAAGFGDSIWYRGAFAGCISGYDSDVSNRPYHKNCRCALHDKSRRIPGTLPTSFPAAGCNSVSYSAARRPRSVGPLAVAALPPPSAAPSSVVDSYTAWEKAFGLGN